MNDLKTDTKFIYRVNCAHCRTGQTMIVKGKSIVEKCVKCGQVGSFIVETIKYNNQFRIIPNYKSVLDGLYTVTWLYQSISYHTKSQMKNLEQREGFVNRHTNGLPDKITTMKVVTKDVDGEHIYLCEWKPFDKSQYSKDNMPVDGYLGTAKVIEGRYAGIGFHAWEQNNSDFVWYAVI